MRTQKKMIAGVLAGLMVLAWSSVDLRAAEGVRSVLGGRSVSVQPVVSVQSDATGEKGLAPKKSLPTVPGSTNADTTCFLMNTATLSQGKGAKKENIDENGRMWAPVENHPDIVYSIGDGHTIIKDVRTGYSLQLNGEATSVKVDGQILTFGGVQDPNVSYNERPQINLLSMTVLPPTDMPYHYSDAGWQGTFSNTSFAYVFQNIYTRGVTTTLRLMDLTTGDIFNLESRSTIPFWSNLGVFSEAIDVSADGKYVVYSWSRQRDESGSLIPKQWFTAVREIGQLLPSEPYDTMNIKTQTGGFLLSGKLLGIRYAESAMARLELERNGASKTIYVDLESRIEVPEALFEALRNYYRGVLPESATILRLTERTSGNGVLRSTLVVAYKGVTNLRQVASDTFIFEQRKTTPLLSEVKSFDAQGRRLVWKRYFYLPNGRLLFVLTLPYPILWRWLYGFGWCGF